MKSFLTIVVLSGFFGTVLSCGSTSGDRKGSPAPNDGGSGQGNGGNGSAGPEKLGNWVRHHAAASGGVGSDLKDVAYMYNRGIFVVGKSGTLLLSPDEGKTWSRIATGTEADLHSIAWVNDVFYVGGKDVVLISTDKGATFQRGGSPSGAIRSMAYTSYGRDSFAFWAVGDGGLILRATVVNQKLEDFAPSALVWEKLSIPGAGNLTGVSMSFGRGLIVGEKGFIAQTHDNGATFEKVSQVTTTKNLLAIDDEVIGGDGVLVRRSPINGMPVGSYKWSLREVSDFPTILGLKCTYDCMVVGRSATGSVIMFIDHDGKKFETEASGIKENLRGINVGPDGRYIAVGDSGAVFIASKRRE